MLIGLLHAIKSHPLATIEELGSELSVSNNMMNEMLGELSQKGYLKSFEECSSPCDNCPVGSSCADTIRPKIWMLTDKGLKVVQTPNR